MRKSAIIAMCVSAFLGALICLLGACTKTPRKPAQEKIVIWHWMTDRKEAFETLAKQYKEQTGIDVEFKLFFPADIYASKVIAAARANTLPDIFGILGEKKTVSSFIKAGHILNLSPYLTANNLAWENRFYPATLAVIVFDASNYYGIPEGIYGIPIDTTILQFVYNKSLFKKAGFNPDNPPATFDEFLSAAKKIKTATGVEGFICGWGEGWLINALATEWAINLMGEQKFFDTIAGKVPYTDPDWIKVFSMFATLRDAGIFPSNIASMNNKEAEDAFAKEKAAFSFNGSWAINVYKQLNPDLNYAFLPLPEISENHPIKIWGGSGSTFMVNAHSPQKQKAVDFLNWLTSKQQQIFLINETNNLPAIVGCNEAMAPLLLGLLPNFDRLTHPDVWPKNEDSRVIEILNRSLQQIILGIKQPAEAAKDVREVKERIAQR